MLLTLLPPDGSALALSAPCPGAAPRLVAAAAGALVGMTRPSPTISPGFSPEPGLSCSSSLVDRSPVRRVAGDFFLNHLPSPLPLSVGCTASTSPAACNFKNSSPLTRRNSSKSAAFLLLALNTASTKSPANGMKLTAKLNALLTIIRLISHGGKSALRALRTTRK